MRFDAQLLKELREDRVGGKSKAARDLHQYMLDHGHDPPLIDSLRTMIVRAERSGEPSQSPAWPCYLEMLGVESQRPSIQAAMATFGELEDRLADLEGRVTDLHQLLADIHSIVGEQMASLKDGAWVAQLGPGVTVRLDPAQVREIVEGVIGRGPEERFLTGKFDGFQLSAEVGEDAD